MTDAEISRALALAIGWKKDYPRMGMVECEDELLVWDSKVWRTFDYRDPLVIWPIAERYDCFPYIAAISGEWCVAHKEKLHFSLIAAKAVALAVIGGARVPRVGPGA